MTEEELLDLYNKVTNVVWNTSGSYHVSYVCGQDRWDRDHTTVSFEVYGHSDQGYGYNWTENWYIDNDGKIYTEDRTYESFEDFKANFSF